MMRRLYPSFPADWAALGLLLLRLAAAIPTSLLCGQLPWAVTSNWAGAELVLQGILGCLLILGTWTPGVAVLSALTACIAAFSHKDPAAATQALVAISLILLGPGAWSLDGLRHGRRKIDLDALED
jgi:uncharacterized membrane protein YphA (DoxX/SURF4 family)